MLGLALEGGGARGAFHMGAVKAFLDEGYRFDGVAGTSIGALNGALIAQGDFETGYKLWEGMDNSMLFDIEHMQMQKILNKKIDREAIVYLTAKIKDIIDNKGLDTSKIRMMLDDVIDEEKLRKSPVDFGLVTVSVSDLKPLELYKEDIPKGKMTAYLMASANLPAFKREPIDGKIFIDGGFYDNCPANLLVRKGYREIIAVRTLGIGVVRKIEDADVKVTSIIPSENLGRILNFDHELIQIHLKMGYFDAMRVIKHLAGKKYYIETEENEQFFQRLLALPEGTIYKISNILLLPQMEPKRMLFEKILPALAKLLKLPVTSTYQEIITGTMECMAAERDIEKYKIKKFSDFLADIKKADVKEEKTVNPIISGIARNPKLTSVFARDLVLKQVAEELLHAF